MAKISIFVSFRFIGFPVLMLIASIFAIGSAKAQFSRGPYLPGDRDIEVPGVVLARAGLEERNGYYESVLLKTDSSFEFGKVNYLCTAIDDGAYGSLKCMQSTYMPLAIFALCKISSKLFPSDFLFEGWICR